MAILFALIALVGWGAGDIFITKVSRKIGEGYTTFWWLIFNICISLLYLPFAPQLKDLKIFFLTMLLGIFGNFGVLLYFRALTIGNASLVGTISGSFALITVPLSIILFDEKLLVLQLIGIAAIIIGLALSTLKKEGIREIKTGKLFSDPGVGLALIAMVMWGIYWSLIRIPVESIGWYWAGFPGSIFFIFLPLMGVVKGNPIIALRKSLVFPLMIIGSIFSQVASFSFNIGLTHGYSSIVAPIGGASPILFVILSRIVFREKLTGQQKMGIVCTLAGIILIAVSSG